MQKQPKLTLRESCIRDVTAAWVPGSFVEMGAGTGYMTRLLIDRGFHGASHDVGEDSRRMMRENLLSVSDRVNVVESLEGLPVSRLITSSPSRFWSMSSMTSLCLGSG